MLQRGMYHYVNNMQQSVKNNKQNKLTKPQLNRRQAYVSHGQINISAVLTTVSENINIWNLDCNLNRGFDLIDLDGLWPGIKHYRFWPYQVTSHTELEVMCVWEGNTWVWIKLSNPQTMWHFQFLRLYVESNAY